MRTGLGVVYILNSKGEPEPCPNVIEWAMWFETADRHVAFDEVGDMRISTVFLGVNHQFGNGPPILWETMIFGGALDDRCWRYSSLGDAIDGHARALDAAKKAV